MPLVAAERTVKARTFAFDANMRHWDYHSVALSPVNAYLRQIIECTKGPMFAIIEVDENLAHWQASEFNGENEHVRFRHLSFTQRERYKRQPLG